jgi:hypothetical protein
MVQEEIEVTDRPINECNVNIIIEVEGDCKPECLRELRAMLGENVKRYEALGIKVRLTAAFLCVGILFADLSVRGALI